MSENGNEFVVEPKLLDLYERLREVSVPDDKVAVGPVGSTEQDTWLTGIPLLFCSAPQVDVDSFFEVLGAIGDILKEHHPERAEDVDKILAAMPEEPEARAHAVRQILQRDGEWLAGLVAEHRLSEELTGFMVSLVLRPFLRHYSRQVLASVDLQHWRKRFCPVCGGHANFSRLAKENGARTLYCSLCETEWPFARIACPFCTETDDKKLRFFTVDDSEKYRVYVCDRCQGYIKTIDEQKLRFDETVELFWEDVKTVHLDLLAMREGYENKMSEIPNYGEGVKQ